MAVTRTRRNTRRAQPEAQERGNPGAPSGFGSARITVKGQPATAAQRACISACLAEAKRLGASRRVMVAVVMCITQESNAGDPRYTTRGDAAGPDSRGPYQQRAPWGPLSVRMDPAGSTRLFLTSARGPGLNGWKAVHGSLKTAPANLSHAINAVQRSAYPNAYAQWEAEATRTVDAWLGNEGSVVGEDGSAVRAKRYLFTRGEKGGRRESSWEASGRLAEEVGWYRYAVGNTLYFVSPQELNQSAPSVVIEGDEDWLVTLPAWEWDVSRPVAECTFDVLIGAWGVMPGAVVEIQMGGPLDGRWLVWGVAGSRLDSPVATVTLRRPRLRTPEPAPEMETIGGGGGGGGAAGPVPTDASGIFAACKAIHDQALPYVWGGGHARAGTPDRGTGRDPGIGYDCSGATAAALAMVGHGISRGQSVADSGWFARSWGKPGRGRVYTVWAHADHVWIELHPPSGSGPYKRLDTSGGPPSGPRLRTTARSTGGFTPRHWEGY